MAVIYPEENHISQKSSQSFSNTYNLEDEKKEVAEEIERIKKELLANWKKTYAGAEIFPDSLFGLNKELLKLMLSFSNTLFYNKIASDFSLDSRQRDRLPHLVWGVVLEKKWSDIATIIEKELGLDRQKSRLVSKIIFEKILHPAMNLKSAESSIDVELNKVKEKVLQRKIINLPLAQAMTQYPKIGEQMITKSPIKIRVFPTPVRPSVKNWIEDYYENIGAQKHGSIERGNFLFHAQNTKGLSVSERQNLAMVFKSLDEGELLAVDPEKEEIVFEKSESGMSEEKRSVSASNVPGRAPNPSGGDSNILAPNLFAGMTKNNPERSKPEKKKEIAQGKMTFSFPHKFPSEIKGQYGSRGNFPNPSQSVSSEKTADNFFGDDENGGPKIKGNVVDLRG